MEQQRNGSINPRFNSLSSSGDSYGRRHRHLCRDDFHSLLSSSSEDSLEDTFSRLALSSSSLYTQQRHLPPCLDTTFGGVPIAADEYDFLSLPDPPANASFQDYNRLLLNTHMWGFAGVGHTNPVGPLGNRTAVPPLPTNISNWYSNGGSLLQQLQQQLQSAPEFDHNFDQTQLQAYLLRKKQLSLGLNSQPQILPSAQFGNGFGLTNSNNLLLTNVRNNLLYNQHLNISNLGDLRGKILDLAKDQNGCRLLQSKFFENPDQEDVEMILTEVLDSVGDLMKNQFGNYLIQKLVAVCDDDQKSRIILAMNKSPFQLIHICQNPHGAKAVQKLLECLTNPQQVSLLMSALSPGAALLANDPNGHHVIQYCLIHFSNDCNQHILNVIARHCFDVARDRSGCCVLQSCVQNSQGESRRLLVSRIIDSSIHLAADPYGNYVVQHMVGLKIPEITGDLLAQLEGNYVSLACNKYGSNVVEKCLVETGEEQSTRIIMELVRSTSAPMLLLDPYGNYVIQSALSISKGFALDSLVNLIRQNASSMRSNLYGKKVLAWFDKRKVQLLHVQS